MILAYLKKEADKEVIRKAKAKEQDIRGYIIGSVYKAQKKRRKYMGRQKRIYVEYQQMTHLLEVN